ncbi:MAG: carbohydrate binding domain-containing protein [Woeseia sp.]
MAGSTFFNRLGKISSLLIVVFPLLALSGCFGEGDGPTVIPGTPITPVEPPPGGEAFDSGLLINGDFEAGVSPWIGNAANVVDDGGNSVNSANIAVAGDAFNVNLSQVLTITEGETYILTFKARSDRTRTMLAGIGLNEAPFTNVAETVNLTANWQTFTFVLTATGFGNANSRVLFDMGAATGLVLIDDVSLFAASGGGGAGGTPIDPDVTLYKTGGDPDLVIPADYLERTPFGSGSIIDSFYAEDDTYSPALSVFSGTNYGANIAQIGFTGFPAGFLGAYETVDFKVKGMPNFVIFVKLFDGVDTLRINLTSSQYSELLVDGWYQVSIPVSRFTGAEQATGIVLESDNSASMQFRMLLTDIGFSGTGTGGPVIGDHGANTAGIFTETTTASTIAVTSITNSADFGGNNTVANDASTAIPAFDGRFVLSIDYQDSGSTFGGVVLNVGGVDLTAYDTLNFTIDTSTFTGLADLTIQLEPPGAGAAGTNVALSAYAPVATSGNWATYAIPFADFPATNFAAVANLGFWNARDSGGALVFGTLYVDDVYVSLEGGGGGGTGGGDHGAGTAGVFTETTTASDISVTSITNSADFGGNNTVADDASTAIPAFDGSVVLSINYQDSGSTFGGAVLNFGGVDLTAYDTLNFTIDSSAITGFADLTIQIEPPGAGAAGTNVAVSAYTPVATSGNWVSYAIPLADFPATDFSAVANLGFWNVRDSGGALVFGTLYVDDVYFSTEGGGGAGDHGPGTAGVYTETTTETSIAVSSITNSADFGGNNTVADPNSTAIPAFDGSVVLSINYQNSGSTFGGVVLNFGGVDLTAYDTLNFTIDTSTFAGLADLTIQLEPPGAGAAGTNVALSAYTPVATSGNWATYAIPFADFPATNFAAVANLGFWNARDSGGALVFGTLYVDDVYFSAAGGGDIAVNGGFETGDFSDWTLFPVSVDPDEQTVVTTNPKTGTYAGRINNTTPGSASIIKQANVMPVATGQTATVSFSARGSFGPGGVAFAEFFTELSGGGASSSQILGGGPLALNADPNVWTDFEFVIAISTDVSGGVTLQLTGTTGGDPASFADVYYDDISIVISGGGS